MNPNLFPKKHIFFLVIMFSGSILTYGQSKKISRSALNLTAGFNFPQTSVAGIPGVGINLGYLYVPIRFLGISAEVSAGTMSGKGTLKTGNAESVVLVDQYRFSTRYTSYGLYGAINLYRLFSMKPPALVTPYLTIGASYMNTEATRHNSIGDYTYNFTMYTNHVGVMFRIKATPDIDFLVSGRYNMTQTYFLDAIPLSNKYDSFISIQAGISYKFGVNSKVDFIDWRRLSRQKGMGKQCPRFF